MDTIQMKLELVLVPVTDVDRAKAFYVEKIGFHADFLAGMFLIFAIWALFGFAYPAAPISIALNVISKIMAFATAVSLFLSQEKITK